MKANNWQKVDEVFDAALDVAASERQKFLQEACNGDDELLREVESLLEAHEKVGNFIESPAMDVIGKAVAREKAQSEADFLGRKIGQYKIEKLLGAGGMGEVFLAHDTKLTRKVALKILPSDFIKDKERVRRFEREARAASALNHPNILTIHDIGQTDEVRYIATEFVDGITLRERLKGGEMSLEEAVDIALQISGALKAAHDAGIIHRDIKPENIMLRRDSLVKVLDFGLAKLTDDNSALSENNITKKELTATGAVMGTASYMSPEQALGLDVDQRSDIFSFGAVLYEMLTGKQPFKGATAAATFDAVLNRKPQPMMELNAEIPFELEKIVEKALEKKRESRYQTASDMRADLKNFLRSFNSDINFHTTGSHKRDKAKIKLLRWFDWKYVSAIIFGVLLITVFVVWLSTRSRETVKPQEARNRLGKTSSVKLTSEAGEKSHPSISPDGKMFVYTNRLSDNRDIYIQRIGEQTAVNLTKGSKENETQPAFSNAGDKIAFALYDKKGGIYVMDVKGGAKKRLTDFGFNPAWSPDDKEIVFATDRIDPLNARSNIPSEIWIVNVTTGEKRSLPVEDGVQPVWSPNSERIAYWALRGGQRDVWTISVKGGSPVGVTNDAATDGNPVWSPDGKFLYFASDRGGNMNFWRVGIDEKTGVTTGEAELVTTPSSYNKHLSISRDGKHFVYVQATRIINLYANSFDPANKKLVGQSAAITHGATQVSNADLSPDGERFALGLIGENQEDIYIIKKDGTGLKQLTNDKAKDRAPRWSPDGKQITFFSDRSGRYEAWTVNAETGEQKQITFTEGEEVIYPFWSSDGTRFVFNRWNSEPFILDPSKNWNEQTPYQLPALPSISGYFWAKSWSSDGKKLSGTHRDGGAAGIVFYDFEKQTYERLTDYGEDPVWLNDKRNLIFLYQSKIFLVDSYDKKTKEIFSLSDRITFCGLSHDNRTIFYGLLTSEAEVWLLALE